MGGMMGAKHGTIRERFSRYIEPELNTGCWLWTGGLTAKGYGQFNTVTHGQKKAHRVSWELRHGPIPAGEGYHGSCVLHRCDTPACVNPDHLFLGSVGDNNADKLAKGRQPNGERHYRTQLTDGDVRELRRLWDSGVGRNELASRFGINRHTAYCIATYRKRAAA